MLERNIHRVEVDSGFRIFLDGDPEHSFGKSQNRPGARAERKLSVLRKLKRSVARRDIEGAARAVRILAAPTVDRPASSDRKEAGGAPRPESCAHNV